MPSNYYWKYSYDGEIVGQLEVVVHDPEYHDDAINVVYVPDDLYPGVLIYEDEVVTSSQPDVRAHELLFMRNDEVMPGADIAFKSGERIDVEDGVTIHNGVAVDLVVDPSLR